MAARQQALIDEEDELVSQSLWLLELCRRSPLFRRELDIRSGASPRTRQILLQAHNQAGLMIRAIFDVYSVAREIELTRYMSQRYPWSGTVIKKSDHLKLVWFQYINLCYLYKERVRVFCNATNSAARFVGVGSRVDAKSELKNVETKLGKFIRRRGEAFHEWSVPHAAIHLYEAVEIISRAGDAKFGGAERGHYVDAKWDLKFDVECGLDFARAHYSSLLTNYRETITAIVVRFEHALAEVNNGGELTIK